MSDLQHRIERFRELHELNPGSRFFAPLADLLRQGGKHDEALALLDEGLAAHPDYRAALVIRGRILQETGSVDEAAECWRQVLAGDPQNELALESLSVTALDACAWSEAVPLLERLVDLAGEDSVWSGSLVEARGHLARRQEAAQAEAAEPDPMPEDESEDEAAAEPAADGDPGSSFDTMTLVDIYLAQGYRERALSVLRRMLPGAGEAEDEIRDRIDRLEAVDGRPEAPTRGARTKTAQRAEPEIASPADRERRDRERAERRDAERKRFEEWLEKIRFNGERAE